MGQTELQRAEISPDSLLVLLPSPVSLTAGSRTGRRYEPPFLLHSINYSVRGPTLRPQRGLRDEFGYK